MASTKRKSFSPNTNILLVSEVSSKCPKCGRALMYTKANTANKNYEIAHIYPLHPKPEELTLLQGQVRLSLDVDHVDNLIALCLLCHNEFDNPRTLPEYQKMVELKRSIMSRNKQAKLIDDHLLESEISRIIDALEHEDTGGDDLSLDPKELNEKINDTMSRLTRERIKQNVSNYFPFIRRKLQALESETPNSSVLLSTQVKSFYLQQAKLTKNQQTIFTHIAAWIKHRSSSTSTEASEIITAFYIQNCEIFE